MRAVLGDVVSERFLGVLPDPRVEIPTAERLAKREAIEVALDLNNLAVLFIRLGQYGEARPLYERALKCWEKALGPEHPQVA